MNQVFDTRMIADWMDNVNMMIWSVSVAISVVLYQISMRMRIDYEWDRPSYEIKNPRNQTSTLMRSDLTLIREKKPRKELRTRRLTLIKSQNPAKLTSYEVCSRFVLRTFLVLIKKPAKWASYEVSNDKSRFFMSMFTCHFSCDWYHS